MTSSLSINDFNGVCRCCGLKKANLQSLFGSSLDHMLKTVASVDVQQNDGLPELICVQCVLLVSRSFQFKAQVEKTYKDLRSILTKSLPNKFKNESFSNKTQDPKNTCKRSEEIMSEDSNNVSLKREPEDTGNLEFVVSNYASCLSNISETPKNTEDHVEIKNNKIQSIIIQLGNESKQANISQREESNILDRETLFSENNPEVQSNQNVTAIRLQENQLHIIDDRVLSFEEQNEKVNAISDNSNYPNLAEFMDVQNFRLTSTASIEVHNSSITRENNEGINDDDTNQVSLLSDVGMDTDDSSMSEYLNREFTVEDVIEHTGFQSNSILQSEPEAVIALLECGICKKNFTYNKQLQRHLKTHNPAKAHICIVCDKGFTEASNLKKHMKKHTGELRDIAGKPNLCQFCGKKFKWATSLAKHMKLHTKKRLFQCPQCPKYYVESCSLKQHLRTHTGEKPFQCTTCDRSFVQSCNLVKHMRVHTGERPFECPVCHKRFSQSGYITVHMRCHNGERPYKCDVCGDSFAGSNTLTTHKRIHTGERPYACDICDKKFGRQETAVLHKMTHTREKPHVCAICEKSFRTSSNLQVHVKSHNLENKD